METIYGILVTVALMWVGWISVTTIQNSLKINTLMRLPSDIDELKQLLMNQNDRLDVFIKNELDALKKIADKE